MQSTSQTPTAGNPVVEPDTQAFLDELAAKGGAQICELSVEDARGVLVAAQGGQVPKLPADIEDRTISGGPKGQIAIRIVRPRGSSGALPVLVYFHCGMSPPPRPADSTRDHRLFPQAPPPATMPRGRHPSISPSADPVRS